MNTEAVDRLEQLSNGRLRARQARAREEEAAECVAIVRADRKRHQGLRDRVLARLAVEDHPAVIARLKRRLHALDRHIGRLAEDETPEVLEWAVAHARSVAARCER